MKDSSPIPISVVMPVFNQREGFLRAAIDSILNQTYKNIELIIIDDGSTNDSLDIIREFARRDARIRIVENRSNLGLVASLNRGIAHANGGYIARMDSDDIALPNRLERQLSYLEQHRDYDLIGSWVSVINEDGKNIGTLQFPEDYRTIRETMLMRNPFVHSTWMFRKSLMDEAGLYDSSASRTEDYDFLLRIARSHRIANLPETLLFYRFNTEGLSFKKNKIQEKYALLARIKALRRYGYPYWQAIYLVRPLFLYLVVPSSLKQKLLLLSFKSEPL